MALHDTSKATSSQAIGQHVHQGSPGLNKLNNEENCHRMGMLSCTFQNIACYPVSDICSFNQGESGVLTPCNGGEHLQNCSLFQCHNMFKCVNNYCIPWGFVCDGKWDCPSGTDEATGMQCVQRNCSDMFRCQHSRKCVHLTTICDNIFDCPFKDDEELCILHQQVCPHPCVCLTLAITCNMISLSNELYLKQHIYFLLDITNCRILSPFQLHFPHLLSLSITSSNLSYACGVSRYSANVHLINCTDNSIKTLSQRCFWGNGQLVILVVRKNTISDINEGAFLGLPLQFLDLSENSILSVLSLTDIAASLKVLFTDNIQFHDLSKCKKLQYFKSLDYHHCCLLPDKAHCSELKPWFFNCKNLLPTKFLKILFYFVSSLIFVLCVISMLLHQLVFVEGMNRKGAFGTIVAWINCSDLLFDLSLTVIWFVDLKYGEQFPLEEFHWRSSFLCFLSFALCVLFLFLHPLVLLVLSLSRLMVVKYPMDTSFKEKVFVRRILAKSTVGCFMLCSAAAVLTWFKDQSSSLPNFLCSPLLDPTKSQLSILVFNWFVLVHTSGVSLCIAVMNRLLFISYINSQRSVGKSQRQKKVRLLIQLVVLVTANFLCWNFGPSFFLATRYLDRYSISLATWIHITVLPINSIVYPTTFNIVTLRTILTKLFWPANVGKVPLK